MFSVFIYILVYVAIVSNDILLSLLYIFEMKNKFQLLCLTCFYRYNIISNQQVSNFHLSYCF